MTKIGTKYKSTNGLVGTIEEIDEKLILVVKNSSGKVTQKIRLEDTDLSKFTKI